MLLPIPFGNPDTYTGHSGVDFPQMRGTPFRASGPGVVSSIDYSPRAGHTVWVRYDNGPNVGYCHMDYRTSNVRVGQGVSEGTVLGLVGSLGLASTGPHLHVEVAGHATTAGFWKFFDRNRVVGQGSSAGEEDEMTPEQAAQLAAISGKVDWLYATLIVFEDAKPRYSWAHANRNILAELAPLVKDTQYRVRGSSEEEGYETGDMLQRIRWGVDALTKRPGATVSDEQIKAIADAVAAQIGQSDATIDYGKVADSVRDRFRTDPLK